jgi:DNA-3-methyladenine glycosylase II
MAALTALKGIGPWTAEIYLLFCIGHPDIFPAGDLALQSAVQHGLELPHRPGEKELRTIAERWSPWRGVAARLLWAYYRARREAIVGLVARSRQPGAAVWTDP